jgi:3-(3-hydroxy-phenyl)propionate hydroxylase
MDWTNGTQPESLSTDVLIVGAGPTGLLLANLLGQAGVDVVIVERNPSTVDEPRAVSIDDESMRAIQAAGLATEVEAMVAKGYGSRYLDPRGHCFAAVDPTSRDYGFEKRNAFQQPELEAVLRRGLLRFPHVRVMFGHTMQRFVDDGACIETEILKPEGGLLTVVSQLMAASDGARSPTRKALGIELDGSTFSERWLIVDIFETLNRFRHTEVYCNPARPCISLPGPGGIRRYEFMLKQNERDDEVTREEFVRDLLADHGPDRDCKLRRKRVYTFHARLARRWSQGRVYLLGDAAHLTPPFAGQGMNSGIRDAHNFAWKAAAVVRGQAPLALLDSYEIERKPHAGAMIDLALKMGRVMMPSSAWQGFAIRAGFRLLGIYPPARDYIAQMRYKPKPRFKAGAFTADEFKGQSTMVGRMFPQPIVERVDRTRLRLDEVLPAGVVALIHAERPDDALSSALFAEYRARGVGVVGLTPEWINPVEASFPIVRDTYGLHRISPIGSQLGRVFLLRPDRYVAGTLPVVKAGEVGSLLDALGAFHAQVAGPSLMPAHATAVMRRGGRPLAAS